MLQSSGMTPDRHDNHYGVRPALIPHRGAGRCGWHPAPEFIISFLYLRLARIRPVVFRR